MTRSDELNELAAALSAAQAEFTAIPKDSTNPFFKSRYAGLPQVVEVASPILTKHGLAVSQFIGTDEGGDTLTTWLMHKSGQFIAEPMRLHLAKQDAQGQGSATTYARRYSYMSVLGLVADEDDDGNKASQPKAQPAMASLAKEIERNNGLAYVNAEDVKALASAATGLTAGQIRLAITSVGASYPDPKDKDSGIFALVPQDKAAVLAKALAGANRETAA